MPALRTVPPRTTARSASSAVKAEFEALDPDGELRRQLLRRAREPEAPRGIESMQQALDDQRSRLEARGFRLPQRDEDTEYRDAFTSWLRATAQGHKPGAATMRVLVDRLERRDIGVAAGSAGGFMAPASFYDTLVIAMKWASPVRTLARVWTSTSGSDAPLPQVDDTASLGSIQAENTAITALDPSLTSKTLKSFAYTSQLVKASWQLAADSAFPLEDVLAELLAARIGRTQNTHFTVGTGVGQPEGFVTAGTVGVTLATGATTTLGTAATAYNSLIDLTASVDAAYRRHPSCAWQMADPTWTAIRKLADTATLPFLEDSDAPGGSPMLLGWPVYINPDMATMAASAKTIAFGAWARHYVIRDVAGVQVRQLVERYADQLARGYLGLLRSDGKIADPKAVRLLAQSAT